MGHIFSILFPKVLISKSTTILLFYNFNQNLTNLYVPFDVIIVIYASDFAFYKNYNSSRSRILTQFITLESRRRVFSEYINFLKRRYNFLDAYFLV